MSHNCSLSSKLLADSLSILKRDYEIIEKLYETATVHILRVRYKQNNEIFVVKMNSKTSSGVNAGSLREAVYLKKLQKINHINILKLFHIAFLPFGLALFIESCLCNLDVFLAIAIQKNRFLPRSDVLMIFKEIITGVSVLHSLSIIHRDLKPHNILIKDDATIKIADYGLSQLEQLDGKPRPFSCNAVTLWYRPIEMLMGQTIYGTCVDMWSLGCILLQLLISINILNGSSDADQLFKIITFMRIPEHMIKYYTCFKYIPGLKLLAERPGERLFDKLPEIIGVEEANLVCRLLSIDPAERPKITDLQRDENFLKLLLAYSGSDGTQTPSLGHHQPRQTAKVIVEMLKGRLNDDHFTKTIKDDIKCKLTPMKILKLANTHLAKAKKYLQKNKITADNFSNQFQNLPKTLNQIIHARAIEALQNRN